MHGQIAHVVSTVGRIFVGVQWSDRAIMIGSRINTTAVAMGLVRALTS